MLLIEIKATTFVIRGPRAIFIRVEIVFTATKKKELLEYKLNKRYSQKIYIYDAVGDKTAQEYSWVAFAAARAEQYARDARKGFFFTQMSDIF